MIRSLQIVFSIVVQECFGDEKEPASITLFIGGAFILIGIGINACDKGISEWIEKKFGGSSDCKNCRGRNVESGATPEKQGAGEKQKGVGRTTSGDSSPDLNRPVSVHDMRSKSNSVEMA